MTDWQHIRKGRIKLSSMALSLSNGLVLLRENERRERDEEKEIKGKEEKKKGETEQGRDGNRTQNDLPWITAHVHTCISFYSV